MGQSQVSKCTRVHAAKAPVEILQRASSVRASVAKAIENEQVMARAYAEALAVLTSVRPSMDVAQKAIKAAKVLAPNKTTKAPKVKEPSVWAIGGLGAIRLASIAPLCKQLLPTLAQVSELMGSATYLNSKGDAKSLLKGKLPQLQNSVARDIVNAAMFGKVQAVPADGEGETYPQGVFMFSANKEELQKLRGIEPAELVLMGLDAGTTLYLSLKHDGNKVADLVARIGSVETKNGNVPTVTLYVEHKQTEELVQIGGFRGKA